MPSKTRPGTIVDVRLQLGENVKYYGLPWRTAPDQWTREDMLAVAARIAPLLKTTVPLKVDRVAWQPESGFRFNVSRGDGRYPWVDAYVHGVPLAVAASIAGFDFCSGIVEDAPVKPLRRARLAPAVEGPHEYGAMFEATRSGKTGRDDFHKAMDADRAVVAKAVKKAQRLASKRAKAVQR